MLSKYNRYIYMIQGLFFGNEGRTCETALCYNFGNL